MIKKMIKGILIIFFLVINISPMSLIGQTIEKSIISNSGEVYKQSEIELQWTLGEMSISQLSNNEFHLDEGFHAEMKNTELSTALHGLRETQSIVISPNPTVDFVRLPQHIKLSEGSRVELYSNNGIFKKEFTSKDTHQIDLSSIPKGMYYLIIIQADKTGSIAKIIKV